MNKEKAYKFVNNLLNNLVVDANAEKLAQYYCRDIIGYFGGTEINFDDIVNHANYLQTVFKNRHHILHDAIVAEDKIIFRARQILTHVKTNDLFITEVTGVYKLKEDKVFKLWVITDKDFDYFESPEHGLCVTDLPNHKDCKSKKQFQSFITNEKFMLHGNLQTVNLTDREMDVLFYTMRGMTAKETGQRLDISFRTVESYIETLREKFDVSSKAELRRKITPGALWM